MNSAEHRENIIEMAALDTLCINTIRFLAVDAVQKANSGLSDAPHTQPHLILLASGSEISLIVAARHKLEAQNIAASCFDGELGIVRGPIPGVSRLGVAAISPGAACV